MAIVFGVLDTDQSRRERAIAHAESQLKLDQRLTLRIFKSGDLTILTAGSASTPYSTALGEGGGRDGGAALVVGDFESPAPGLDDHGANRVLQSPGKMAGGNGYYLAAHLDAGSTLRLGVDYLSYFPLYYWDHGGSMLFGTSPELFRGHARFDARLSADAVTAMLMFSHPVDNFALYEGVYRIRPGEQLVFTPDAGVRAIPAARCTGVLPDPTLSYEQALAAADVCVGDYFQKLTGHNGLDFFVSGGQDSRFLAGYVAELPNQELLRAVTVGNKTDNELAFARKMVAKQGWKYRIQDAALTDCNSYARQLLAYESMGYTFVNLAYETACDTLTESGKPFLSGYFGDMSLGDRHANASWNAGSESYKGEKLIATMRRFGFEPEELRELLSCEAVDERINNINQLLLKQWEGSGELDWQRGFVFAMHNRQRHHVGGITWRLSLGAWPLLPYVDANLIKLVTRLPKTCLTDRVMQSDIIKQRFPKLARLPLDNNGRKPVYLQKPASAKFRDALPSPSKFHWRIREWLRSRERGTEKRYYFRVYDYNSSAWKGIRGLATTALEKPLEPPLNAVAIADVLGDSTAEVELDDGIIDSAKYKTLVGLTLGASGN
ncbi:MAG: hypothetical protein AB8B57_04860 [Congregibacter sp.]